jgi:hypothetical protein
MGVLLASAALSLAVAAAAPSKEGTVEGEVIDTACYLKSNARGEQHKKCAVACSKDGFPAGIVDASGKVYTILASSPGLAEHQASQARATGVIHEPSRTIDPKRLEIKKDGKWQEVPLPESMM